MSITIARESLGGALKESISLHDLHVIIREELMVEIGDLKVERDSIKKSICLLGMYSIEFTINNIPVTSKLWVVDDASVMEGPLHESSTLKQAIERINLLSAHLNKLDKK